MLIFLPLALVHYLLLFISFSVLSFCFTYKISYKRFLFYTAIFKRYVLSNFIKELINLLLLSLFL